MKRVVTLFYGIIGYVIFLLSFFYAIGFVGDFGVPKTINSGNGIAFTPALLINMGLLGLFAVQHSLMARDFFKRGLTKIIPKAAERSTYVLLSSLLLLLIFWQWQPLTTPIWHVASQVGQGILYGLFGLGWIIVLLSTFMIDHFDLFGLRQVFCYFKDKKPAPIEFQTPYLYKYVRHPLMLGFIIGFWATPTMTMGHLIFAIATTGYILLGIQFEERSLVNHLGKVYEDYRQKVPMLIPIPGKKYTKEK